MRITASASRYLTGGSEQEERREIAEVSISSKTCQHAYGQLGNWAREFDGQSGPAHPQASDNIHVIRNTKLASVETVIPVL
jgi:hypothetical protein